MLQLDEEGSGECFTEAFARQVVRMMNVMPHGVAGMSRAVPGLVEVSTRPAAAAEAALRARSCRRVITAAC